jgi:hypothetical protein
LNNIEFIIKETPTPSVSPHISKLCVWKICSVSSVLNTI